MHIDKDIDLSFANMPLHPTLLANLRAQGFTTPTPIQAEAIPLALAGGNLIGLAQTGTGKTAAFVLPILHRLLTHRGRGTRALIVAPTRELAEQIHDVVAILAKGTGLRGATIYGGVAMGPQEHALRAGVDLLIACPGRLLDHLGRGTARLDHIETVVLDEADRMLDMGFLPAIKRLLAALPPHRQTMLFSATLSAELRDLVEATAPNATTVQIGMVQPANTVTHAIYPVQHERKTDLLIELLHQTNGGSVLVFTRTKHRANRLSQQLARDGYRVAALHSNRSQNQRKVAIDGFRDGRFQVLVATDIAARGIDIDRVGHVINYDIPDTPDAYIHRIGRTGRAERNGDAFTLVTVEDVDDLRAIERTLGSRIERREVPGFEAPILPERAPAGPGNKRQGQVGGRQPAAGDRQQAAGGRRHEAGGRGARGHGDAGARGCREHAHR
jgi:ATP-dependent RNA helicase RhlE